MNSVLITGSSSGIASAVQQALQKRRWITGLTGREDCDLSEDCDIDLTPRFDCIIHIAAMTGVKECEENPIKAAKTNVVGTLRLLEAAKASEVKRFVYVSTASAAECESIYALTKLEAELFCKYYSPFFPVAVVRLNYVYGEGINPDRLISRLAAKLERGEEIEVEKDFKLRPTRVEDAAAFIAELLSQPQTRSFEAYDIGGRERLLTELIEELKAKRIDLE